MRLTIDTHIPVPESRRVGKGYTAAIRQLKPGQSVLLPTTYKAAMTLCYALYTTGERKRGAFVVRAEGDGARVWRR